MESTADNAKVDVFNRCRPRLFGIAYRMLGIVDDVEDVLQEAYIRWHQADETEIETPEAWLVTVVTRIAIDRLRKAARARETYIGPWLPEPLITTEASPAMKTEIASEMSLAFMVLLERLSPLERAVFLLHDVFDLAYAEIARVVAKNETAVRQIVSRARTRVRSGQARYVPSETSRTDLLKQFLTASYAGDEQALMSIFAPDIALTTDGGGKVHAARRTVYGDKRLSRLYTIVASKHAGSLESILTTINGEPGIVDYLDGVVFAATTFTIEGGRIVAIYRVMNPDKLKGIPNLR